MKDGHDICFKAKYLRLVLFHNYISLFFIHFATSPYASPKKSLFAPHLLFDFFLTALYNVFTKTTGELWRKPKANKEENAL